MTLRYSIINRQAINEGEYGVFLFIYLFISNISLSVYKNNIRLIPKVCEVSVEQLSGPADRCAADSGISKPEPPDPGDPPSLTS